MRRGLQSNEIRTNICFEFNVVGAVNAFQLQKDIMTLATKYVTEGHNTAKLVGILLKKPTASTIFLTLADIKLESNISTSIDESKVEDSFQDGYEEEGEDDDQESNRND